MRSYEDEENHIGLRVGEILQFKETDIIILKNNFEHNGEWGGGIWHQQTLKE